MSEEHTGDGESALSRAREARERVEAKRERFYEIVSSAIDSLPEELRDRMENLEIVIADWPSPSQMSRTNTRNRFGLLGLYEGIPHTRRGHGYNMVLPDKITVFRKPIEARCRTWREVEEEITRVALHEIAHHFGIDDATLRDIEERRRSERGW
jgi:predicted Zn-dependent protease with MMP-like domain